MYSTNLIKRSWVEIDLEQLKQNYISYRSRLPAGSDIIAVVKADAYGHGSVPVCRALQNAGVHSFAVSNLDEAKELRDAGIKGDILILGYTPIENAADLLQYDITQTLLSEEYADEMLKASPGGKIKCQVALDTGMNRIGLRADDPEYCEKIIRRFYRFFHMTGIFTHLCVADSEDVESEHFTKQQINLFRTVADRVQDLHLPYVHGMNSAGGLYHANETPEIVRLGIVLYGMKPDYANRLPEEIRPVLTWKSVVSMVKDIRKGDTVGYGRTFTAERNMKIATVPTGYADGYRRELSNRGQVWINGKKAPVVGRICMDQFMADVSGIDCRMGDEVTLIGEHYTADDMAHEIGTIGYEIVCGILKRVARIYQE